MVLYVHVMLFFICLNFGLGITTIPDTPLYIEKYQKDDQGNLLATTECFHSFQSQALIIPIYQTPGDDTTPITGWTSSTFPDGSSLDQFVDTGTGTGSAILGNVTGGFDPFTNAIEGTYAAGETIKNIFLGGYITNILGGLSMQCDIDPSNTATYGTAIVSPVMMYIIYFVNVVFGVMLLLAIIYVVTGKSFGL